MRKRNLLAAGAILSLTGAGLFHPSPAITSCQENGTCRDLSATVEGQAPDIRSDDSSPAPRPALAAPNSN